MAIRSGKHVMLFGPAGAGKTFVFQGMRHMMILRYGEENIISTATLKIIAGVNDGYTLHHTFKLPTDSNEKYNLVCGTIDEKQRKARHHVSKNSQWFDRIFGINGSRNQKALFLDEVSTLTRNEFEFILCLLGEICCSTKPFGGLQIVLSGDPLQNSSISLKDNEKGRIFGYDPIGQLPFFTSPMFHKHFNICMIFDKGHRFHQSEWYQLLLRMRVHRNTKEDLETFTQLAGANGMTEAKQIGYIDCANALAVDVAFTQKNHSWELYTFKKNKGTVINSHILVKCISCVT